MSYLITKSDGTTLLTIADQTIDASATSLGLPGKNVYNYGKPIAENFVYLLENFSNTTAPINPLKGQLWYDSSASQLKVYSGTAWGLISAVLANNQVTLAKMANGPPYGVLSYDGSGIIIANNEIIQQNINVSNVNGTSRGIIFQTAGVRRWAFYTNTIVETGSNIGSNLVLKNYSDAGTELSVVFSIARSSGIITFGNAVILGGDPTVPLGAATKQYVDSIAAPANAMKFKGSLDCSTNPNYPSAITGDLYRASVAGKIGGVSGVNVDAGDIFFCLNTTTAGDQIAVGTNWTINQANIDGAVTLNGTQTLTNKSLTSPTLTGTPIAPTAAGGNNTTQVATTAFVTTAISGISGITPATVLPIIDGTATVGVATKYAREDHIHPTDTTRAPLASPSFTGVPLAPTPTTADNSTKLATTAFVATAIAGISGGGTPGVSTPTMNGVGAAGTSSNYSREDHVHPSDTSKANLASPALTGTPTVPTASVNTNTTQIASTAFVLAQAGVSTPNIDGTAAAGTSTRLSREDHVHPTDTTRAPLASPTFTGTPAAPTATAGANTTQLATTAFVTTAVAGVSGASYATTSQFWARTSGVSTAPSVYYASLVPVTVAFSTTISLDLNAGTNFDVGSLTSNFTLTNFSNLVAGKAGRIRFPQDATGSRLITYGTGFKFAIGAVIPLSTAANAVDYLYYEVMTDLTVLIAGVKGVG